jgi:arylsulfatase A-like enzyme
VQMKLKMLAAAAVAALCVAGAETATAQDRRPNVLVIVADDLGFSDLGALGGEIDTPNLDRIAERGVRLTGFHTAPTCSPTRSMLLTGADNHRVGLGTMNELIGPLQRGKPGYEGYLNDRAATLPERLVDAGYQTLMVGKWHLGLTEDRSPAARGFQRSFALLQGLQNHYGLNQDAAWEAAGEKSTFREGRALTTYPVGVYSADYYAQRMSGFLKEADRDRPFFAYLTFAVPHWPLQAPPELIAKYRGRYDAGPEALRDARLNRQKALGLVPKDVQPAPLTGVRPWASLTADERAVEARKMEVYAAMVDSLDRNVGKVLETLEDAGELDDTIILFISDNGPEGGAIAGPSGKGAGTVPKAEAIAALKVDNSLGNLGAATSYFSYGPAWAQAASAPHRSIKGYTTEGGIHAAAFIAGPGIQGGRISGAFLHVKDIAPTILEYAGVQPSRSFHGREVLPIEGHSWRPLLEDRAAEVRPASEPVGWELFFRRALRQGDWKIVYQPSAQGYLGAAVADGRWALYNLKDDPAEVQDLAATEPDRLKALVAAWDAYAKDAGVVLPPEPTSAP